MSYNPFSLAGKTIIVTGASSGIGAQTAIDCSKMGANIILCGRNLERLKTSFSKVTGKDNLYYAFDLTNFDEISRIIENDFYNLGPIDGVVHAAGISTTLPFKFSSHEKFESFMRSNVIAGVEFTRLLLKKNLLNKEGASLIFISSVMGLLGENAKSLYSASKGALISLTKSLAIELAHKKIRVNCISPGVVDTPMTKTANYLANPVEKEILLKKQPLGIGEPCDISNSCIFLLSEASKWITGSNLIIDGGYSAH